MSFSAGRYEEAKKCYKQILRWREQTSIIDKPSHRKILADLGAIYYKLGNFQKAEVYFNQALSLCGSSDLKELAGLSNDLGLTLCAQGRNQEGQVLCTGCMSWRAEGETIADQLMELAEVYCSNNKFSEAKPLCEAAFDLREDESGGLISLLRHYVHSISRLTPCEKTSVIEARIRRLQS